MNSNRGSKITGLITAHRVIAEPCYVTLITTVKENRATCYPVGAVDEVPLCERPAIGEVKVVQLMGTQRGEYCCVRGPFSTTEHPPAERNASFRSYIVRPQRLALHARGASDELGTG